MLGRRTAIGTMIGGVLTCLGLSRRSESAVIDQTAVISPPGTADVQVIVTYKDASGKISSHQMNFTADDLKWKLGYRKDQIVKKYNIDGQAFYSCEGPPSYELRSGAVRNLKSRWDRES